MNELRWTAHTARKIFGHIYFIYYSQLKSDFIIHGSKKAFYILYDSRVFMSTMT